MDKLCAKCGKQLRPDQGFCEACGTAWAPDAKVPSATVTNPVVPPAAAPVQAFSKGGSGKSVAIVAIALIVAIGLGGWLFLRYRGSSSSVETSSRTSTTVTHAAPPRAASTAAKAAVIPTATDTSALVPMASAASQTPSAIDAATEVAANSKPCSVVTRAEVEQILGTKIIKLTTSDTTCLYYTDETRSVEVATTWADGKAAYLQMKGFNSAPGNVQEITGIGDEAYSPVSEVLHVLKGDTYVVVNARVYPNVVETESAIARKVMEKLK
jgi:hypothetical protein